MKTSTHIYAQVKYYLAIIPGFTKVEKFADYADAFAYSLAVGESTGRVVAIEAVY